MRLRLLVRRHNLPDAPVVWSVDTSTNPTVYNLLEEVNAILPLESNSGWGLEDYVVEVKGSNSNFECLHFQPVQAVLHEDDEVLIRPLLSQDLKQRRVSGRHQIRSDGIHLYDGVVFGRPRRAQLMERPEIAIPPRKRARITYHNDERDQDEAHDDSLLGIEDGAKIDGDEVEEEDRMLLTLADLDDDEDDEDDEDFEPAADGDVDSNRQLVITADFEDDDDEEDDDFEPGEGGGEDEEEDKSSGRQLMISADFEDDDEDHDEDYDEDYDEEKDEDLVADGDQTGDDSRQVIITADFEDEDEGDDVEDDQDGELDGADEHGEIGKEDASRSEAFQEKAGALRSAFPTAPIALCRSVLLANGGDIGEAWDTLNKCFKPVKSRSKLERLLEEAPANRISTRSTRHKEPLVALSEGGEDDDMDEDDNSGDDSEKDEDPVLGYYDQHELPPGSISTGKGPSRMAEILRGSKVLKSASRIGSEASEKGASATVSHHKRLDDSTSGDENSDSDDESSDESSSSDDSEDDSDSPSAENDSTSSSGSESDSNSSTSDSDSDSDSDSESGPEESSSKAPTVKPVVHTETSARRSTTYLPKKAAVSTGSAPGHGKTATRARNERRRRANILQRFQDKGILPAGTTLSEFGQLDIDSTTTPEAAAEALAVLRQNITQDSATPSSKSAAKSAQFEKRRQELLASLASGGIDVSAESSKKPAAKDLPSTIPDAEMTDLAPAAATESQAVNAETRAIPLVETTSAVIAHDPTPVQEAAPTLAEPASEEPTPRRRTKLNLGAASRLLFGALGVRTPKTKADEEKVKKDLMKHVRPVKTSSRVETTEAAKRADEDEDPEAWRQKITLRAVECCYEGVELSEPPFPFVQRWDPQQQYNQWQKGKRGSKGKKRQRNQNQYYGQEEEASAKKQKRTQHEEQDEWYNHEPNQDVTSDRRSGYSEAFEAQIDNQIMRDVQEAATSQITADEDDLPALPKDMSVLTELRADSIKTGMVIAFKQLTMSEATSWQPEISPYRTAVVTMISENGEYELTLAKRDREYPERYYDEETGERLYAKFDMPDDDDEEDPEVDGLLVLTMAELMEPKIVQMPPDNLLSSDGAGQDGVDHSADDSVTLANQDEVTVAKSVETSHSVEAEDADMTGKDDSTSHSRDNDGSSGEADVFHESISEEARHDISLLMHDAGFRSDIPSSILRARQLEPMNNGVDFDRLRKDMTPGSDDGTHSPRFNGFGSSPSRHDATFQENSASYPRPSGEETHTNQVSDHGHQPDFPTPGDDTMNNFDDMDSFLNGGYDEPPPNTSTLTFQNSLINAAASHQTSTRASVVSLGSSDIDFPTLEELISASQMVKKEKIAKQAIQPSSSIIDGDREYQDAMEKLDAELDEPDESQLTPKASKSQSQITFSLPPGSQQIDLTLSSDAEEQAPQPNHSPDDDDNDVSGLPKGPGWVEKKAPERKSSRKKRQASVSSKASSQQGSQNTRSSRRKTRS